MMRTSRPACAVALCAAILVIAACDIEPEPTPVVEATPTPVPTVAFVTATPIPPATPLPAQPAPTLAPPTPVPETPTPTPTRVAPEPTATPVPPTPTPEPPPQVEARLTASDGRPLDHFGWSVAMDGDTIVVGAPVMGAVEGESGAAYVFRRTSSGWREEAKLAASDATGGNWFGVSVAVSGDTIVVGAPRDSQRGLDAGAAYVFVRNGSTWTQQAKLTGDDTLAGDQFGASVAIDGDRVVVGAPLNGPRQAAPGAAYAFGRNGQSWVREAKLTGIDAAAGDLFGTSVAIQGDRIVVGAEMGGHNCPTDQIDEAAEMLLGQLGVQQPPDGTQACDSGSAYVFVLGVMGWNQGAKLIASDAATNVLFGSSVSIDGNTIAIGAYRDYRGGRFLGAAYVFTESAGLWREVSKLTASEGQNNHNFGYSVAASDGRVAIGAYSDQREGFDAGAVYVFRPSSETWSQAYDLRASKTGALGTSVAMSQGTLVAGAPLEDDQGVASGAVYVFR